MPSYSQDVIEQVREGNDIVSLVSQYVPLKKKGAYHFGLCPFHRETSPSFSVTDDKQIFYCFGCGVGGNVISFIMRIENLGFTDTIKFLADRIHITLPENGVFSENKELAELKETVYEIHTKAARFFYEQLSTEDGSAAVEYLNVRQVSQNARRKYGLGYSPASRNALFTFLSQEGYDLGAILKSGLVLKSANGSYYDRFNGRLMFPIFDLRGRVIGFGGRIINAGEPKYLNSPDTMLFDKSRNLYSMNFARKEKSGELILAEGYMDVISLYQAGFKNAVAALGTAFNMLHVYQLKKVCQTVILLFDSDEAGQKAALRAIEILRGSELSVKVLRLEGAKDPDEYIKKYGAESFAKAMENAVPCVTFQIQCALKDYNLQNTDEKVKFTKDAAFILSKIENSIERDAYSKDVMKIVDIDEQAIKNEIEKQENKLVISEDVLLAQNRGRNAATNAKGATKGIDDARRNVLLAFALSNIYSESLKKYLTKEEFVIPVYSKLFEVIESEKKKKDSINPADLINFFEELDEQQAVSNIFSAAQHYEDEKKALSDQIREIKLAYCDELLVKTIDMSEMQKAAESKINISSVVIEL